MNAVVTFRYVLLPFACIAPCAETLMSRIVARKMAVLDQALLVMAASDEGDFLVITHSDQRVVQLLLQLGFEIFLISTP